MRHRAFQGGKEKSNQSSSLFLTKIYQLCIRILHIAVRKRLFIIQCKSLSSWHFCIRVLSTTFSNRQHKKILYLKGIKLLKAFM